MNKSIWIVANFKSNKNISETLEWISTVGSKLDQNSDLKIAICPSFSALEEAKKAIQVGGYSLVLGSQDLSAYDSGAHTGDEPAALLNQLINLSIIGHSERRKDYLESDELVAKKFGQAIKNNITPLVCVQDKNTELPKDCKLVAYEPVWAIGSGEPDTPANANNVAMELKKIHGQDLEVLYGGSVDVDNIEGFIQQDNLSGVLIATGALDPENFLKIVEVCS